MYLKLTNESEDGRRDYPQVQPLKPFLEHGRGRNIYNIEIDVTCKLV